MRPIPALGPKLLAVGIAFDVLRSAAVRSLVVNSERERCDEPDHQQDDAQRNGQQSEPARDEKVVQQATEVNAAEWARMGIALVELAAERIGNNDRDQHGDRGQRTSQSCGGSRPIEASATAGFSRCHCP
jgi:hypothetical protein